MTDLMNFDLPKDKSSIIKVIGVGGGGTNAINHMFQQGIADVDFVICNTDSQSLENSPIPVKIQLGESLTQGRGAGNKPEQGREAAIESLETISEILSHNTKMVFITAGMGGGTGTGAAPIIAKEAKEQGVLTVGIVTIPFRFEGTRRINQALEGIEELKEHVDSLLVINNEKLREIFGDLKLSEAFSRADNVLTTAAKGIAEIITVHGYINVDFADVHTVMSDSGVAIMGSANASGEERAIKAIQEALTSPLLNDNDIHGATNILLNITSGKDEVTMDEIGQITDYVQESAGLNADIIWGNGVDESLDDKINVTIIATGFDTNSIPELMARDEQKKKIMHLEEPVTQDSARELNFEIKNSKSKTKTTLNKNQKTIEFDDDGITRPVEKFSLEGEQIEQSDDDMDDDNNYDIIESKEKAEDRSERLKETHEKLKDISYSIRKKGDIDTLENEPAYKRSKIEIEDKQYSADENADISKFVLSDDDEDENSSRISEDNSFLYDNVD
jgi:cell division protein FtsZ